jgi:hypothetical protein
MKRKSSIKVALLVLCLAAAACGGGTPGQCNDYTGIPGCGAGTVQLCNVGTESWFEYRDRFIYDCALNSNCPAAAALIEKQCAAESTLR